MFYPFLHVLFRSVTIFGTAGHKSAKNVSSVPKKSRNDFWSIISSAKNSPSVPCRCPPNAIPLPS